MSSQNTEHPDKAGHAEVGSTVRSAMIWTTGSMIASQVLNAGLFILLMGRLDPQTFGVFALVSVFTEVFTMQGISVFVDSVIQRQDFSRRVISSVYWTATVVMAVVAALLIGGASFYADIMQEPEIVPIMWGMSLSLLLNPLVIGPHAILRQRHDYKGLAIRTMFATVLSGLIALAIAYTSYAGWALVAQRYAVTLISIVVLLYSTRAFPGWTFSFSTARDYLASAARIFAAQGITASLARLIDLFIGFFFGTVILGCFRVAYKLVDVLFGALILPINQLWISLVPQAGENPARRREVYLHLSKVLALTAVPSFLGVALVAHSLADLMFEEEYAPVGDILAITCAVGVFLPLSHPRFAILTAVNRLNLMIWISVLEVLLVLVIMFLLKPFGWTWVVFGAALQYVVFYAIAPRLLLRTMATSIWDYLAALAPPYVAGGLMAAAVIALNPVVAELDIWQRLVAKICVGALVYVGCLLVFYRGWTIRVVRSLRDQGQHA